ncbi:MAG: hypothetical protein HFH94_02950 [Lachnospiraceae bacterium]|nr:FkbM family methyltransferase [uncultured Acetatifactor sp.]MCI9218687.1 hypothetical protein [Lachnospiraceae bacterium]
MEKYYQTIDRNIKHIIDSRKQVVIYPMGMMGVYAREILNKRYGREGIYVDNVQCAYSGEIISFREMCALNTSKFGVLVCSLNKDLEIGLIRQCEDAGIEAVGIRNPCVCSNNNKAEFFGEIIELCKVEKAIGFPMVRIGKCADGGYIMPDDFDDIEACYSFGIGTEVSWEEDMATRGIDVYCYDHTIDHMPGNNEKLHFFRNGIAGADSRDGILKTMETFLRENKSRTDNLILKMDVEGAEWEFLQKVEKNVLSRFKQMTFELHNLTDERRSREIFDCLNKLKETHQPVWVHGNNAGLAEKAGDYVVPQMLEIIYVRKDSYKLAECEYNCPIYLDYPNISDFNEIVLQGWGGL